MWDTTKNVGYKLGLLTNSSNFIQNSSNLSLWSQNGGLTDQFYYSMAKNINYYQSFKITCSFNKH